MGPSRACFLTNARDVARIQRTRPDLARPAWGNEMDMLIAASLIALVLAWTLQRRVPLIPLVTAAVVAVFGGLTLYLDSDIFIKMKPTIVNTLFGVVLLGGLVYGTSLLGYVFNAAFQLDAGCVGGNRHLDLQRGILEKIPAF